MNKAFSGVLIAAVLNVGSLNIGSLALAADIDVENAQLDLLTSAFFEYSGTRLVFSADRLPPGPYFDAMPELPHEKRLPAALLLCHEAQKYPPQYLGKMNLKAIGVFEAGVFKQGDNFRPYDKELQGYRFFGLNNNRDGIVAAYYTDEQLPLTFHHEIFHTVDRLSGDDANVDRRLAEILAGKTPYPPLRLQPTDLQAIKKLSGGQLLEGAVSDYAAKNAGEDKAETARHFMTTLPASLVQASERSRLPGSQRILHILHKYQASNGGRGPGPEWFAGLAADADAIAAPSPATVDPQGLAVLLRLRRLILSPSADTASVDGAHVRGAPFDSEQSREILQQAALAAPSVADPRQADQIARLSAALLLKRGQNRIRSQPDGTFIVRGGEGADGVNWTLRNDLAELGQDAEQFKVFAKSAPASHPMLLATQIKLLRLVAGYYMYIASHWQVTDGTRKFFEEARNRLAASMPEAHSALAVAIMQTDLSRLDQALAADGRWNADRGSPPGAADTSTNPFLANVDAEVKDPSTRAAIRRVQPACVRVATGSGVTVSANGCVLTAAHVARRINGRCVVTYPDGQEYIGVCIAIDNRLDLALCQVSAPSPLPFARLAGAPPDASAAVVCIGQPGKTTPGGQPTGYEPFNVSTGHIRGFLEDRVGDQRLGRTKHDAWTYWGHSGSPLFNEQGEIVAMHNSWDSRTAMRHAVTHEAIARFLQESLHKAGQ